MTCNNSSVIRDYTLTRTSIPNHAGNIKDMKYALIRSINTESLTKMPVPIDWDFFLGYF